MPNRSPESHRSLLFYPRSRPRERPVFDFAGIESTRTDGQKETFIINGKTYFNIVPEYTNDGGHLNQAGRINAAEQLLLFLINLP